MASGVIIVVCITQTFLIYGPQIQISLLPAINSKQIHAAQLTHSLPACVSERVKEIYVAFFQLF